MNRYFLTVMWRRTVVGDLTPRIVVFMFLHRERKLMRGLMYTEEPQMPFLRILILSIIIILSIYWFFQVTTFTR